MQGFTPIPVNQKGARGEETSRGITNSSVWQRRRRAKCIAIVHTELLRIYDEEDTMWIVDYDDEESERVIMTDVECVLRNCT